MTIVTVKRDLLGQPRAECPVIIDYTVQAKAKSTYNTPNVWGVYIFNLVLKWVHKQGGVEGKCVNYHPTQLPLSCMYDCIMCWLAQCNVLG